MRTKKTAPDKFERPKLRHTEPCSECPWRRKHPVGWLGGYDPAEFTSQVHHDGPPLSCHKTDTANPPSMCAGALVHMKNSCKSSRHPAYGDALDTVKCRKCNGCGYSEFPTKCKPCGGKGSKMTGPSENHAWFIWDWQHVGPSTKAYGP